LLRLGGKYQQDKDGEEQEMDTALQNARLAASECDDTRARNQEQQGKVRHGRELRQTATAVQSNRMRLVPVCAPRLLRRHFRFVEQQGFDVGQDEARIECAGTVDISDAAFSIDEKNAEDMIKRALRIFWILSFVHRLTVAIENLVQVCTRFCGRETPFAA